MAGVSIARHRCLSSLSLLLLLMAALLGAPKARAQSNCTGSEPAPECFVLYRVEEHRQNSTTVVHTIDENSGEGGSYDIQVTDTLADSTKSMTTSADVTVDRKIFLGELTAMDLKFKADQFVLNGTVRTQAPTKWGGGGAGNLNYNDPLPLAVGMFVETYGYYWYREENHGGLADIGQTYSYALEHTVHVAAVRSEGEYDYYDLYALHGPYLSASSFLHFIYRRPHALQPVSVPDPKRPGCSDCGSLQTEPGAQSHCAPSELVRHGKFVDLVFGGALAVVSLAVILRLRKVAHLSLILSDAFIQTWSLLLEIAVQVTSLLLITG